MRQRKAVQFLLARCGTHTGDTLDFFLHPMGEPVMRPGWYTAGKINVGDTEDPWNVAGIWRNQMTRRGKQPTRMRWYRPTNPRSEAQQANRAKFAEAMAAWQGLTSQQREAYAKRAKKIGRFGWGLFISEFYQQA